MLVMQIAHEMPKYSGDLTNRDRLEEWARKLEYPTKDLRDFVAISEQGIP